MKRLSACKVLWSTFRWIGALPVKLLARCCKSFSFPGVSGSIISDQLKFFNQISDLAPSLMMTLHWGGSITVMRLFQSIVHIPQYHGSLSTEIELRSDDDECSFQDKYAFLSSMKNTQNFVHWNWTEILILSLHLHSCLHSLVKTEELMKIFQSRHYNITKWTKLQVATRGGGFVNITPHPSNQIIDAWSTLVNSSLKTDIFAHFMPHFWLARDC